MFQNIAEAREAFQRAQQFGELESAGVVFMDGKTSFMPGGFKNNNRGYSIAMDMAIDAQPSLVTDPNAGIPWYLTNYFDPDVLRVVFAPVEAANIYGEEKKGNWTTNVATFITVEHDGEVSSYGDYANNGMTNANTNFPQRQNYRFQTIKKYGELELETAGEARINWVSELDQSAANNMNRFANFSYFFGIQGLQNYGAVNDPNLPASLSPAIKSYGGTAWFSGSTLVATPTEVYNDILAVYTNLVVNTKGNVKDNTPCVLALAPQSYTALKGTNSFGIRVRQLLEDGFEKLEIKSATQFGAVSASNPQGIAAGNMMQMFAKELEGQRTSYCAFSEKMRSHPIIRELSAFAQKTSGGTFGTIIRIPIAFSSMVGI